MQNKTLVSHLRKQKGWTQERLAEETGLSVRTIQRIEKGNDASLETLGLVANALEVSINHLFSQEEMTEKMKVVTAHSDEQESQLEERREATRFFFSMFRFAYLVVMLLLGAGLGLIKNETLVIVASLLWVFCFVMGFRVMSYIKSTYWKAKMDKKYPLIKHIPLKHERSAEQFYWWKNSRLRPVFMIFLGIIIPLLYTLVYVFHIF